MKRFLIAALLLTVLPAPAQATLPRPELEFMTALGTLCNRSFEGRVVTTDPADAAFVGKRLVMGPTVCSNTGRGPMIRLPFQVGEDRSRTWIVTMAYEGLRLKHDHRHADGSEDALSGYGGMGAGRGTEFRQEFPADEFSKALFKEKGNPASVDNVWALEISSEVFAYELRRPNRHFRVEFDLTKPLP